MAEMNVPELVEMHDHWTLPLDGLQVTQCRFDYAFTIVTAEATNSFEIRIAEEFTLQAGDGSREDVLDPEQSPGAMAPALSLLRQTIRAASAFKDGRLRLEFEDGTHLQVPVGQDFEAWDVVGPLGLRLVSLPGGDLAIWSAATDEASAERRTRGGD